MHRNLYRLLLSAMLLASGPSPGQAGALFSHPIKPSTVGIVQHKPVGNVPTHIYAKAGTMPRQPARKKSAKQKPAPPEPAPPTAAEPAAPASEPASTNKLALASTNRVAIKPAVKPNPEKVEAEKQRLAKNLLEWQQSLVEKGSSRAQYDMGVRYLTGDAVPQDKAKGVELLKKAAAGGETLANRKLKELGEPVPEISATETP